jgi:hypothetical protein
MRPASYDEPFRPESDLGIDLDHFGPFTIAPNGNSWFALASRLASTCKRREAHRIARTAAPRSSIHRVFDLIYPRSEQAVPLARCASCYPLQNLNAKPAETTG